MVGVAVTKRSSRNIFFGNLGGRRSCHSHMYSPSGWLLPYRHTLSLEHNSSSPCDPNQGTLPDSLLLQEYLLRVCDLLSSASLCPQCTVMCFGKGVFPALKGIYAKCVWEAQGRPPPNVVLITTMSVTTATWEH